MNPFALKMNSDATMNRNNEMHKPCACALRDGDAHTHFRHLTDDAERRPSRRSLFCRAAARGSGSGYTEWSGALVLLTAAAPVPPCGRAPRWTRIGRRRRGPGGCMRPPKWHGMRLHRCRKHRCTGSGMGRHPNYARKMQDAHIARKI